MKITQQITISALPVSEVSIWPDPNYLLVTIKLIGANYPTWSESMIHSLMAKSKIDFINGSIKPPSESK